MGEGGAPRRRSWGTRVPIEGGHAFVPGPLPPRITYTGDVDDEVIAQKVERAMLEIGRLDMAGALVGGAVVRLVPYMAREAVASSGIEGTSTTISDLLMHRATGGAAREDGTSAMAMAVEANARALEEALRLVDAGSAVGIDVIRRAHRALFEGLPQYVGVLVPGEFRTVQNRIGGTCVADATYVPPPPDRVPSLMQNLEDYIASGRGPESSLVRCAIAHCQFESIHPFPDGNGRVGRILILLMMRKYGLLGTTSLNISRYLLTRRSLYYETLHAPRDRDDWARWIAFFVDACGAQARAGISAMMRLESLRREYHRRTGSVTRSAGAARVADRLVENPYITVSAVRVLAGLGHAGASDLVRRLVGAGILRKVPTGSSTLLYVAPEVMRILLHGDEGVDAAWTAGRPV